MMAGHRTTPVESMETYPHIEGGEKKGGPGGTGFPARVSGILELVLRAIEEMFPGCRGARCHRLYAR